MIIVTIVLVIYSVAVLVNHKFKSDERTHNAGSVLMTGYKEISINAKNKFCDSKCKNVPSKNPRVEYPGGTFKSFTSQTEVACSCNRKQPGSNYFWAPEEKIFTGSNQELKSYTLN